MAPQSRYGVYDLARIPANQVIETSSHQSYFSKIMGWYSILATCDLFENLNTRPTKR